MAGLPAARSAVQAVITHKWDTWARRVLIWEFGLYLIWLLGFQAFIILFQVTVFHPDPDPDPHPSSRRTALGSAPRTAGAPSAGGPECVLRLPPCCCRAGCSAGCISSLTQRSQPLPPAIGWQLRGTWQFTKALAATCACAQPRRCCHRHTWRCVSSGLLQRHM